MSETATQKLVNEINTLPILLRSLVSERNSKVMVGKHSKLHVSDELKLALEVLKNNINELEFKMIFNV